MKSRIFALALAVGVALVLAIDFKPVREAQAQPAVNTWGNVTITTVLQDTLPRFGAMGTTDSAVTTPAVYVGGSRAISVILLSNGTDTVATPQLQVWLPGASAWLGTGGAAVFPQVVNLPTGGLNTTTAGKILWQSSGEQVTAGGTPLPCPTDSIRFKMKSADARRYNTALSATLAPTGTMTMRVYVWR